MPSKFDVPKTAMKAPSEFCLEAALNSNTTYKPCGSPARYVVKTSDTKAYPMCAPCADHNVRNRNARYVRQGEEVPIAKLSDMTSVEPAGMATADVEDGDGAALQPGKLKAITEGVSRALKLQELIIPELKKELALRQEEYKALTEQNLPNVMTDANVAGWTYTDRNDGIWEVALKEDIRSNVKVGDMDEFVAYLETRREDGIVKRQIIIEFGRDQVKEAKKFLADLAKRKTDLNPIVKQAIPWNTLDAYVRERRQEAIDHNRDPNQELPPIVGVHQLRMVTFKQKDKKKGIAAP